MKMWLIFMPLYHKEWWLKTLQCCLPAVWERSRGQTRHCSQISAQRDLARGRKQLPPRDTLRPRAWNWCINSVNCAPRYSWLRFTLTYRLKIRKAIYTAEEQHQKHAAPHHSWLCEDQPIGRLPSRWLLMSQYVPVTTHGQHLPLKCLCAA